MTRTLDIHRVFVVVLLAPAILILTWLIFDTIRHRRAGTVDGTRRSVVLGVGGRIVAFVYLASLAGKASGFLRIPADPATVFGLFDLYSWQVALVAIGLAIGLIGLGLAVVPARPSRRPQPRRASVVVSIALAGIAGVIFLAYANMMIPYLVLIAIDAVRLAMLRPGFMHGQVLKQHGTAPIFVDPGQWHSLHDRLIEAGIGAGIGMIVCMLTAYWVGRDLRRPEATPKSWLGLMYRASTTLLVWVAAPFLAFVSIARLQPPMAEGIASLLYPNGFLLIVPSLCMLAAGIAARGTAPRPSAPEVPTSRVNPALRWIIRIAQALGSILLVMLIIEVVENIYSGLTKNGRPLAGSSSSVATLLLASLDHIRDNMIISTTKTIYFNPDEHPEAIFLFGGTIGVLVLTARLLFGGRSPDRLSPIDLIVRDRRLLGRFLGAWFAITGMIFCLFPALFLGAMAVFHLTLRMT